MTDLTDAQRAALRDAHISVNHGGLLETCGSRGPCWIGEHPECEMEHRPHVIDELRALGLVERSGRRPMRSAQITEHGIMELDLAGLAA